MKLGFCALIAFMCATLTACGQTAPITTLVPSPQAQETVPTINPYGEVEGALTQVIIESGQDFEYYSIFTKKWNRIRLAWNGNGYTITGPGNFAMIEDPSFFNSPDRWIITMDGLPALWVNMTNGKIVVTTPGFKRLRLPDGQNGQNT